MYPAEFVPPEIFAGARVHTKQHPTAAGNQVVLPSVKIRPRPLKSGGQADPPGFVSGLRIEDYAMIGDTESAALVGTNGSVDWLCAPRFDSPAFFAALLGTEANGHWQIAPVGEPRRVERRYRPGTLVLETDFETEDGAVRLAECMPPSDGQADLVPL